MPNRDLKPVVILIDPQMGENIGMVARAMLNCGLNELRIVRPRDGWPSQSAIDTSAGAVAVIDGVKLYETTKQAIAELNHVYATTGRARGMMARILTPRKAGVEFHVNAAQGGKTGILFGGERSGLNNDDISLADSVITVPLNPDFKSLNLAQSVLLVAYEWFQSLGDVPQEYLESNYGLPASKEDLMNFLNRLEMGLDAGKFFRSPEQRPIMIRNLRNMFQRANLSEQEVRTLHGIIKALQTNRSDD
jgi:tRNA/rRNA methyltransferase